MYTETMKDIHGAELDLFKDKDGTVCIILNNIHGDQCSFVFTPKQMDTFISQVRSK